MKGTRGIHELHVFQKPYDFLSWKVRIQLVSWCLWEDSFAETNTVVDVHPCSSRSFFKSRELDAPSSHWQDSTLIFSGLYLRRSKLILQPVPGWVTWPNSEGSTRKPAYQSPSNLTWEVLSVGKGMFWPLSHLTPVSILQLFPNSDVKRCNVSFQNSTRNQKVVGWETPYLNEILEHLTVFSRVKDLCSQKHTALVQWLRILLAVQGIPVRTLVQGDPTAQGYDHCAHMQQLLKPGRPVARAPPQEGPPQWEARAPPTGGATTRDSLCAARKTQHSQKISKWFL